MSSARVLGDWTTSMFGETYHNRILKKNFTLLPETYNGRTAAKASTKAIDAQHREPFLPRIRVEECGLTVESRDRESWKRVKRPAGKSWKPGKKRREKFRHAKGVSSDAHEPHDRFLTQEQRDNDSDVLSSARSVQNKNQCNEMSSGFVDSLRVGGFPTSDEKSADTPGTRRAPRWPVGKLAYSSARSSTSHSSPHTSSTTPSKTDSLTLRESPKPPRLPLPEVSSRTSSQRESRRMSPRERVLLNKLATKRKRHTSFPHKHDSASSRHFGKNFPENHKYTPIDFDQYLPTTHCMQLATLPNAPTQNNSSKHLIRGREYYDIVDDATQKLLQKHQNGSSTSSGIGSASSGSRSGNSSSESVVAEWQHEQSDADHNKNCPLSHDFQPSDVGNFCPPNTPDYLEKG